MTNDRLLTLLGNIDEDMILDAEKHKAIDLRRLWTGISAAAICIAVIVGAFIVMPLIPKAYELDYEEYITTEQGRERLDEGNVWIYYVEDGKIKREYAKMPLSEHNVYITWQYLSQISDTADLDALMQGEDGELIKQSLDKTMHGYYDMKSNSAADGTQTDAATDTTSDKLDPPTFEGALELIDDGEYESAYYALLALKKDGDEMAREKLKDFHVVVSKVFITNRGGSLGYEYTYDERGNVIVKKETVNGSAITPSEYENTYDSNGFLIRSVCISGPDSNISYEYTYSESGRMTKKVHTQKNGESVTYMYQYYDSGQLLRVISRKSTQNGPDFIYYIYDEYGRLQKTSSELTKDLNTVLYTYDDNGNLIKKIEKADSTGRLDNEYTYDENGNETIYKMHNVGYSIYANVKHQNTYDDKSNLIYKVTTDAYGEVVSTQEYEGYLIFYRPGNPLNELPNIAKTIPSK